MPALVGQWCNLRCGRPTGAAVEGRKLAARSFATVYCRTSKTSKCVVKLQAVKPSLTNMTQLTNQGVRLQKVFTNMKGSAILLSYSSCGLASGMSLVRPSHGAAHKIPNASKSEALCGLGCSSSASAACSRCRLRLPSRRVHTTAGVTRQMSKRRSVLSWCSGESSGDQQELLRARLLVMT